MVGSFILITSNCEIYYPNYQKLHYACWPLEITIPPSGKSWNHLSSSISARSTWPLILYSGVFKSESTSSTWGSYFYNFSTITRLQNDNVMSYIHDLLIKVGISPPQDIYLERTHNEICHLQHEMWQRQYEGWPGWKREKLLQSQEERTGVRVKAMTQGRRDVRWNRITHPKCAWSEQKSQRQLSGSGWAPWDGTAVPAFED